jgi:hypothetical protein
MPVSFRISGRFSLSMASNAFCELMKIDHMGNCSKF